MFAARTNWNLEPNRLARALAQHRVSGKPLLDLTASNPTDCGFEYPAQSILRALSNPAALAYNPDPRGLESARRAVAAYYASHEREIPLDGIFLTSSTSEAYSFAFRLLCDPGDEVLIPSPGYPLFDLLAGILDVKLVRYPLVYDHGWQIDFPSLRRAVTPRSRAVIVVHPNNPTGHFAAPQEAALLNEFCSSSNLGLIADEVFLDFSLAHSPPVTFAENSSGLTFTLSGLSKISGLPQMKAAWLIASGPANLRKLALDRLEVIADTYLSPGAPVQCALPELLEERHRFQAQLMQRVRRNLADLDLQLTAQKPCSRLALEGGWYAVLRVPATRSDEDLALALLSQESVFVHPGHFYDFAADGYLVLSLITPEVAFREGLRRLLSIF